MLGSYNADHLTLECRKCGAVYVLSNEAQVAGHTCRNPFAADKAGVVESFPGVNEFAKNMDQAAVLIAQACDFLAQVAVLGKRSHFDPFRNPISPDLRQHLDALGDICKAVTREWAADNATLVDLLTATKNISMDLHHHQTNAEAGQEQQLADFSELMTRLKVELDLTIACRTTMAASLAAVRSASAQLESAERAKEGIRRFCRLNRHSESAIGTFQGSNSGGISINEPDTLQRHFFPSLDDDILKVRQALAERQCTAQDSERAFEAARKRAHAAMLTLQSFRTEVKSQIPEHIQEAASFLVKQHGQMLCVSNDAHIPQKSEGARRTALHQRRYSMLHC